MRHLFQIVGSFQTFTFHKVSTSSRCNGIFNAQFITQLLLSLRMKKLKIDQHLLKLWAIKYRVVFYETRCTFLMPAGSVYIPLVRFSYCRPQ